MDFPPNSYALITGASQGLGKHFAQQLAAQTVNLILVGLPDEGLEKFASSFNDTIKVHSFEMDLTKNDHILELSQWINKHVELTLLINNAGTGGNDNFMEISWKEIDKMIQLNIKAIALLTHQLLPNLLKRQKSYILNISSMAALSPMAYKTIYPASKAFVSNFTQSLQEEYKNKNIIISVVHPGPIKKNKNQYQGFFNSRIAISPEKIAKISLAKLLKGKEVIKLNLFQEIGYILMKSLPQIVTRGILSRIFRKKVNS